MNKSKTRTVPPFFKYNFISFSKKIRFFEFVCAFPPHTSYHQSAQCFIKNNYLYTLILCNLNNSRI